MRKIFLIIALAIASFTFAEEAQTDSIETVETETIEYIEQTTDSVETSIENVKDAQRVLKVLRNGIVYIIVNGKIYTPDGKLIG